MSLVLGIILLGLIAFQWLTREITVRVWGPASVSFHRDAWPAFFGLSLLAELGLAGFLIYCYF